MPLANFINGIIHNSVKVNLLSEYTFLCSQIVSVICQNGAWFGV